MLLVLGRYWPETQPQVPLLKQEKRHHIRPKLR
uniref:Uncharacterized protein n=1 Tax=Anguilla anguilla TaxID=7936 RepID=A0A0E9QGX2_ANGAN